MPAQKVKPKATTRSVRYLLSADRRLQKLSLRKMAGGPARSKSQPAARGRRKAPASTGEWQLPWTVGARAMTVGGILLVGAAVMMSAGGPSERPAGRLDIPVEEGSPAAAAVGPEARPAPLRTAASATSSNASTQRTPSRETTAAGPAVESRPAAAAASGRSGATPTVPSSTEKIAAEPLDRPARMDTTARPLTADAAPRPGPLEPPAPAAAGELAAVTITGCLETDGRRYRLADTSGAEAPKSRSWRSGFLKKRSAAVELAESGGGLALAGHVGRRVAATGVLVDRRMEVRSLRRLAASCD